MARIASPPAQPGRWRSFAELLATSPHADPDSLRRILAEEIAGGRVVYHPAAFLPGVLEPGRDRLREREERLASLARTGLRGVAELA